MKKIYLLFVLLTGASFLTAQQYTLNSIGVFTAGAGDEATEILAYDAGTQRVFVVNSDLNDVQVLSLADPSNPTLINTIDLDVLGQSANSVDVKNGMLAVALEGGDQQEGSVAIFDLDGNLINQVTAGFLPDMVTFTNAGDKILVANEGEPSDDYTVDPEGSVTIVDVSNGAANATATQLSLAQFTDADALRAQGVRIFGPNASPAQDLEPEYIAVSPDDSYAFVTCQENNAVLRINIAAEIIDAILPLGFKDYSLNENGIDASDRSAGVDIRAWDSVVGMPQPDGMDCYMVDGTIYFVTANEGDARDYDGYSEEVRVDDLTLDPTAFPNAAEIQAEDQLGRLKTTTANGDTDGDGDTDIIYSYGARSFSIYDMNGNLVFDSGNEFVRRLQDLEGDNYVKNRSDDKGSEPESIEIAEINGEVYAFIGLERQSSFFIYNITDPANAFYAGYGKRDGDIGPEDAVFISAADSPNGRDLLIASNEVSGTVTVFEVAKANKTYQVFDEELAISDYEATDIVLPPSPLEMEVIFVGGHDIVQTTATYGNPAGQAIAKEWHDFIGWTPDETGQSLGWVTVNHEQIYRDDRIGDGGGMTAFRVVKDANGSIDVIEQTLADGRTGEFFNVDFVNTVGETGMNCAGISAPNGRIWTAEEWFRGNMASIYNGNFRSADRDDSWNPHNPAPTAAGFGVRDTTDFTINAPEFPLVDGMTIPKYQNFNYMVEVDPKEAVAIRKQYNWGRAGWEGGQISADGMYVYLGMDSSPAPWIRITASTAWDFNNDIKVEAYKEDNPVGQQWVEMEQNVDNVFGDLINSAWEAGATMFMRNEWVTIDQNTGMVYWTETGRDGSSGAGARFAAVNANYPDTKPASFLENLAQSRFGVSAMDPGYQDYYGRVWYYDPATEEIGVVIDGGPYFESSPEQAAYPGKHLSNPDGLNMLTIDGVTFLMISEDLNGTSNGRTPEGISNRLCELYLLPADSKEASVDDLVRVTAVPAGAEITGPIQIDDNVVLLNSQHPNATNPFPYNHSLTFAIYGWENLDVESLKAPNKDEKMTTVRVNETSRELYLPELMDCAIYNSDYERIKVLRNVRQLDLADFAADTYYVLTNTDELFKLIVE
jgi:secreted PhoX family phosphatase